MPIILFREPECVMVRIAKTGSTSIVRGLFGGIENATAIQRGEFPEAWRGLYSFAFVRNPFDRLVSAWLMFKNYCVDTDEEKNFRDSLTLQRMMDVVENPDFSPVGDNYFSKLKLHCLPMTSPFFHLTQVADIYRFEDFPASYGKLAQRLGRTVEKVPHCRKSVRRIYQSYYTARERVRAESLFRADLEEFGYSFASATRHHSVIFSFWSHAKPGRSTTEPLLELPIVDPTASMAVADH